MRVAAALLLSCSLLAAELAGAQPAEDSECATTLVQLDIKGVLQLNKHCSLNKPVAEKILKALGQIRHDFKLSQDQTQTMVSANNLILGSFLKALEAGHVNSDSLLQIPLHLANRKKTKPGLDELAEAKLWKENYDLLADKLALPADADSIDNATVKALQNMDYELAGGLLDEINANLAEIERPLAAPLFLRAQLFLLLFQPENALPLLDQARQLEPQNREYAFAYASAAQSLGGSGSVEAIYNSLLGQYRQLAVTDPGTYRPAIASTLNNLGLLYSKAGRNAEAESAYREALDIRRELAKANPALKPALVMTLNNLSLLYRETGNMAEEEKILREALELRRELAKSNPEVFRPAIASTLVNLAYICQAGGRAAEAETAYREAVDSYRTLAQASPSVYKPEMAVALNNLGNLYSKSKRYAEAEKAYTEALELRRQQAKDNPEARPRLATTLNNLGNLYRDTKRYGDAEKVLTEALDIQRPLAREKPETYQADLAATLSNFGNIMRDTRQSAEALKAYQEAMELQRGLVNADPAAIRPKLALTLNNLGALHEEQKNWAEAEKAYREALALRRDADGDTPKAGRPELASSLSNLANLLSRSQKLDEAEKVYRESVALRRDLATDDSTQRPDLAVTLNNLGTVFYKERNLPAAADSFREALDIERQLYQADPASHANTMKAVLDGTIAVLDKMGRKAERERVEAERAGIR